MSTVLIDFSAVKSGGGAQLALNFLDILEADISRHTTTAVLLPDIGPLSMRSLRGNYAFIRKCPAAPIARISFERGSLQDAIQQFGVNTCYTFFGCGIPCPNNVVTIITVAYPIICYPESPFWQHLPLRKSLVQRAKNSMRVARIRRAWRVLVETEVMRKRIETILHIDHERIGILRPSPSEYVRPRLERRESSRTSFLFLSGPEPHKNLWRLPSVAKELLASGIQDFEFAITVPEHVFKRATYIGHNENQLLAEHFHFLGVCPPTAIQEVYEQADVLVSLSDLESFSNNYMEAWKVGLPIIASDRDFAREICRESALYVEPHDVKAVADLFRRIVMREYPREQMLASANRLRDSLPNTKQRYNAIWNEIECVAGCRPAKTTDNSHLLVTGCPAGDAEQ